VKNLTDWSKNDLLILAFDHRASFIEKLFGIKGRPPTADEKKKIEEAKQIIFEGFQAAVEKKVPKEIAGLLVDEEFGAAILREAKKQGFNFAMPAEKSGQDEFDFEYGEEFAKHIEAFDPTFLKVLVRYNPESDASLNQRQLVRLKKLSDYLASANRPFLFELIVPATSTQLASLGGSKQKYDLELRPKLMCEAIKQIQDGGVEPAIWKLEGVEDPANAKAIVMQAQAGGRKAGVITLGRGESKDKVKEWLAVGAKIPGIIGFAVGRTIFWDPLVDFKAGKADRKATVERIAQNYIEFVELWLNERKK
jgi:myo-inositol catabolism protein IolC